MATFVLTLDWTDQGIRNLREAPERSEAAKALPKTVGAEINEVYLTTGRRVTPGSNRTDRFDADGHTNADSHPDRDYGMSARGLEPKYVLAAGMSAFGGRPDQGLRRL